MPRRKTCTVCGDSLPKTKKKWCDTCRYVVISCYACGRKKTITRTVYEQRLPGGKKKTRYFCSRKCSIGLGSKIAAQNREDKIEVICPNCGKVNKRKRSHAYRKFCDVNCYGQYRRDHPELYPPSKFSEEVLNKYRRRTGRNNPAYGLTGDKSPHWKGGRDSYRGKGWKTIRKLIKRRDSNQCMLCKEPATRTVQMDVHHIYEWANGECNHPYNLITVCASCHQGHLHGNSPAPPDHQLVALAQHATHARLAQDDLQLIVELDRQQRHGKGLPWHVVEKLGLPDSYLHEWQQLPLPVLGQFAFQNRQGD